MDDRNQIEAIVIDAVSGWGDRTWRSRRAVADLWTEVRRQLRALRDTTSSLAEDERLALQVLRRLQAARPTPPAEASGD